MTQKFILVRGTSLRQKTYSPGEQVTLKNYSPDEKYTCPTVNIVAQIRNITKIIISIQKEHCWNSITSY